jgi:hypothetical protein
MKPFDPGTLFRNINLEAEAWEDPKQVQAYLSRLSAAQEALGDGEKLRTAKDVFETEVKDLEADKRLAEKIHRYKQNFINRNKEHAAFFGGNLLGVNVVRFVDADRDNWFDNIIAADEELLREQLHELPGINPEWHVSSNVMNLSCAYLAHRFFHSALPAAQKREAMFNVFSILQFKFVSSILYRFFPYPADKQVAEATYAALNMKFILKEKGSWLGLLNHRCEEILSRSSPHYNAIAYMDSDKEVVDMLNAIHGALKGYIKNMREVMERIRLTGGKVSSVSSVAGVNGEEVLKDKTRGPAVYTNYLKSVLSDKNSFIREELLLVITKIMPSAKYQHLRSSLEHMSDNYFKKDHHKIEKIINLSMVHAFAYLSDNRISLRSNIDLSSMLLRLKGAYTSSRSTDPDLLELRNLVEEIIRPAVDSRTEAVVASVRTGVLMYMVSRAYTMQYYSNQR